jgi:hypothetical protein
MRRTTGLTRVLWRITALLQLFLPPAISIADARLEREAASARAFSHIEANTTKDCARVHAADCALCQHLTTPQSKASKPAPPVLVARAELPAIAFSITRVVDTAPQPTLPRAPPVA